jgi:hypothetical protein
MRNFTSHGIIITCLFGLAEYTTLINDSAHRLHAANLKPEWVNIPHSVVSLAFAVLCLVGLSHVIPIVARLNISLWKGVLEIHRVMTGLWLALCKRIERWTIEKIKSALWSLLAKVEDHTAHLKDNSSERLSEK